MKLPLALQTGLALAMVGFTLAVAQPPVIDDPEARVVKSLVDLATTTEVEGLELRIDSPAWWVVSSGENKVYIFGVPWSYPANQEWSRLRMEARIQRAGAVIMPPVLSQRPKGTIQAAGTISPEQVRRLKVAAIRLGQPAERYINQPPLVAGSQLVADFRQRLGLTPETVIKAVQAAAAKGQVKMVEAGRINAGQITYRDLTATAAEACLEAALDEVESGTDAWKTANEGWAVGRVNAALATPRSLELCTFALPGMGELRRLSTEKQVWAAREALTGKSMDGRLSTSIPRDRIVMIVGLRTLVAENGVLDQLRRLGFTIEAPTKD